MTAKFWHKHRYVEQYGGRDEQGAVNEIWWECECGRVIDSEAKARAAITSAAYFAKKEARSNA